MEKKKAWLTNGSDLCLCIYVPRSIVKKDKRLLMLVIPMLMLMLTILSGPCNGNIYHRFTYPVAMCIPIVAGYGLRSGESKTISDDR